MMLKPSLTASSFVNIKPLHSATSGLS